VKALLREVSSAHGRLDALINNAGAASMNHVLLTPVSTVEKLMNTNVLGTWLVSRESAKLMQQRKYGRIVNFSSVAVPMRLAGQAIYAAAKCAVVGLSQVMAREVAEFGITVNVVGPPPVATDMIRGVPQEKIDKLLDSMPIKRLGTMEDIANVIDFFLRPESAAVTGQVIYLNGVPN
jgi:3-oxoacyl-[acyl-carrier protein] reductase